jgi:mannose-6-phosphate isomerase-like protein (cupin superfamily)
MDPARGLLGLPIARTPVTRGTRLLIERITHGTQLLAIIVPHSFRETGIHFFTEAELSQQLAYMRHPAGKIIAPHLHNPVLREVHYTQEVLIIKRGRLRVDFYDETRRYLQSRTLVAGDTIILVAGGHGFEVLEEVEMIEVKQGPYAGDQDKTTFLASGKGDH